MAVKKIVANIDAQELSEAQKFYGDLLGMSKVMDMNWINTFSSGKESSVQISIASEGGSGTPVPDLSIEVDNLDEIYTKAQAAGYNITYPMTLEPWGVRRFYVEDPFGKLVNILSHQPS